MNDGIEENTIFIAGGSGMVGSALKRTFSKMLNKRKNNLKILTPTREELNLLDVESVRKWFKRNKPNIVILAAAKVGGILANSTYPADFLLENLKIQTNVIETSYSFKVNRFIFLGSSCIYPKFAEQPIREESLLQNQLEKTNENYAIAKIAGLKLCESLRLQYGFDAISLMPTNLYGPNDNYHPQNSHVVAALIRKFILAKHHNWSSVTCWGSGNVLREFMHVDDLAEAILFCLEKWHPSQENAPKDSSGEPLNHINIGTGTSISIKDLASKISTLAGYKGNIYWDTSKPEGTPEKTLDTKRINDLGWKARINLDFGLQKTIDNLDISKIINN